MEAKDRLAGALFRIRRHGCCYDWSDELINRLTDLLNLCQVKKQRH